MNTEEQLADIRQRWAQATPGPWFWHGNTDNHRASIAGRVPGLGVVEVITTVGVDRSQHGRDAQELRSYLVGDAMMSAEGAEEMVEEWATNPDDSPREDQRLALSEDGWLKTVEDLAVFEVARNQGLPDDTGRNHERIYRADIVDVRNANGRALAASWADVSFLLDLVETQARQLAERTQR